MPASIRRSSSFSELKKSNLLEVKDSSVKRSSSFNKFLSRVNKPTESRLTLEVLQSLTPYQNGQDVVTEEARALLVNCIKMEPHVHEIFFPTTVKDSRIETRDLRGFPIDKLATAFVAQAISKTKDDQKFHQSIDKNALEETLQDLYNSVYWKKVGFSLYTILYPEVVRDEKNDVSLQNFIDNDGHVWAEKMLATMMDSRWTMSWLQKIIRGVCTEEDYNAEMNAVFVKLHLLDPQSVIPAFQFLLNQRALPAVNLELATRNYLGGPLDCTVIQEEIMAAILKTSVPVNLSRLSLNDVELFCGVEVDEFIVTECRNLGVWNGKRPDNHKKSKVQDRCIVM